MDDIKREIYMLARSNIESGHTTYLCFALEDAAEEVLGLSGGVPGLGLSRLADLFPEFYKGFSGVHWVLDDGEVLVSFPVRPSDAWWPPIGEKLARLRYLDMLMAGQMTEHTQELAAAALAHFKQTIWGADEPCCPPDDHCPTYLSTLPLELKE